VLRSARLAVGGLGVLVALTSCAGTTGAPADPGPVRPSAGGPETVVDAEPLTAPVVIDPLPAGVTVRALTQDPAELRWPRATLYGEPALTDTLDGPVLLVGSSAGSARIGGPPLGREGDQRVDIGGQEGWLVHDGDRTWVAWPGYGEDYVEFVVGRGIDDDALIRAARSAHIDAVTGNPTATVAADAVPEGLEPLVSGAPQDGPYTPGVGERIVLDAGKSTVFVSAVRADPRLSALWGFWAADPIGTLVRDQPGSAGDMPGIYLGDHARGQVWAEDGMVLSVIAAPAADDVVDQVVRNLRVGTADELETVRRSTFEQPPTAERVGCPPGSTIVSAVEGDARWAVGLGESEFGWRYCTAMITSGDAPNSGGSTLELPAVGQMTTWGTGGSGEGIPSGRTYGGVAPPGTARVTVSAPDGHPLDAVLGEPGPRPGEVVFGAFVAGPLGPTGARLPGEPPTVITAYDATGAVLATLAQG